MSFISYAQNFEDVMLWRALKHVGNGFYIDVGANDPTTDSVTRAFYERGWSGINIEPLPSHHADLLRDRPRDINVQCALGALSGEIEVWECDVRGWATASAEVVAQHTANGHQGTFHKIPLRTLADICSQYARGEIHFLKIDVEGFEKSVIDGADFSRFRPWILVIEATRPNSVEEIHGEWEAVVLESDYILAYSDGLNRFYVAKEHTELINLLRYPPNVFDGFIRSDQLDSELRAQQAEGVAQQAEIKAQQAEIMAQQAEIKAQQNENRVQHAEARAQQAEARATHAENLAQHWQLQVNEWHERILAIYASTSWRVTKPLRAFKRLLSGDFAGMGRKIASSCVGFVFRRPALRKVFSWCLKRFPPLHTKLLQVAVNSGAVQGGESPIILADAGAVESAQADRPVLNVGAYRIYMQLKKAAQDKHGVGQ